MFRESLIESVPRGGRGTGAGFPLSVAIHALVVATAVVLSARALEEPPDPPTPVIYQVSLPPPAGSGDSGKAPAPARRSEGSPHLSPRKVFPPAAFSAPLIAPSNDSTESAEGGEEAGEDSGNGGSPDGVEGGTGTEQSTPSLGEGVAIPVSGKVVAPQLVLRVEPAYPETARIPRIQGLVILEAIITTDGRVEELRVLRSPSSLLSDSAVAAVSKWRYQPATLNGRAVKVFLTVNVEFKIH
jgi:periplasmic protein TonB